MGCSIFEGRQPFAGILQSPGDAVSLRPSPLLHFWCRSLSQTSVSVGKVGGRKEGTFAVGTEREIGERERERAMPFPSPLLPHFWRHSGFCTLFSPISNVININLHYFSLWVRYSSRCVLTPDRVRHVMCRGNQIHSINLWTLGIPKMYMRILGYNIQILH